MDIEFSTSLATLTADGGTFATLEESVAAAWREGAEVIPRSGAETVHALCKNRLLHADPNTIVSEPNVEFVSAAPNPQNPADWTEV